MQYMMTQQTQAPFKIRSYVRVSDKVKKQLVDLVFIKEWQIKQAAAFLSIKYATAKHIINRHRQTNILKNPTNSLQKKRCLFKPIEKLSNPIKLICTRGGQPKENQLIKK